MLQPLSRVTPATIDILRALDAHAEPVWGLLLVKESGRPPGSVYPILERLERSGWITSAWEDDSARSGPRRRYYELTEDGAGAARAAVAGFEGRTRRAPRPRAAGAGA